MKRIIKPTKGRNSLTSPTGHPGFPYVIEGETRGREEVRATRSTLPEIGTRRNRASTIVRTDRFKNIAETYDPFIGTGAYIDMRDILILCQQAYRAFAPLRNIIEIKNSICSADILLKDGNTASESFIQAWLDKINVTDIQDQFYRELYRSGNVFFYKFFASLSKDELKKLVNTEIKNTKIPLKYITLNPVSITTRRALNYSNPDYYRWLTRFEMDAILRPVTEEDQRVRANLSDQELSSIKNGIGIIRVDPARLIYVPYQKQNYEPFAVPTYFAALETINAKMEMQKMDMALARTTDWAILLITMGAKKQDGGYDPAAMAIMRDLLSNESVKKSIVSDYTTKGEWLIPEVDTLLGPAKYQQLNQDLQDALSPLLFGPDKFATAKMKMRIFSETIKQDREKFTFWLNNEIKEMCKNLGFKSIPTAYYPELNLEDASVTQGLLLKFMQSGLLTPKEFFTAVEDGELPSYDESVVNQKEFKSLRDEGLYMPIVGGALGGAGAGAGAGRPTGTTGIPQKTQKVSPVGTSKAETEDPVPARELQIEEKTHVIPLEDLHDMVCKTEKLKRDIVAHFKKKKIEEEVYQPLVAEIATTIQLNTKEKDWVKKIASFTTKPTKIPAKIKDELDVLSFQYDLPTEYAALVYLSKKDAKDYNK